MSNINTDSLFALADEITTLRARVAELEAMGEKVNAIRNSIVGLQCFNFSEHAYPLVAALDEAGFAGTPYPEARANVGTLLERANKAEARVGELERERDEARGNLRLALEGHDRELASAPSAEPTPRSMTDCMMTHHPSRPCTSCEARRRAEKTSPRDMRVAEAVREAYDRAIIVHGRLAAGAIDLAAVVAKAVGT